MPEAARAKSIILLPESIILLRLQALSAISLVFHGVFSERFCVLGLRSQVFD
jgi:hypothetical protein